MLQKLNYYATNTSVYWLCFQSDSACWIR